MDIGPRPLENLLHFIPVGDVLIVQQLNGSTGDDETVELAVTHLFPRLVEGEAMFSRCVLGAMTADAHERQLNLKRRGANEARHLDFRLDLVRHEVEKPDLERADILSDGRRFGHDPHALVNEGFKGGKRIGNLDRHVELSFPDHVKNVAKTKKPAAEIATGPRKLPFSSTL